MWRNSKKNGKKTCGAFLWQGPNFLRHVGPLFFFGVNKGWDFYSNPKYTKPICRNHTEESPFVAPEKATSHGFGDPAVYVQVDSKKSDTPFRSVSSNPNSFCVGLAGPRPCKVFFERKRVPLKDMTEKNPSKATGPLTIPER